MTAAVRPPEIRVRPLVDSRPPDVTWLRPQLRETGSNQPPLDLAESGPASPPVIQARATVVRAPWTARPRPDLPDAAEWSAALAVAVVQAVLAQRPIAQLNRWLAEDVLAEVSRQQRRRRTAGDRAAMPVTVRSVRVQHPHPEVAEGSAHLSIGNRSEAVALRLEAVGLKTSGGRWLCTALALGPQLRP